jgi:hypothetical protein
VNCQLLHSQQHFPLAPQLFQLVIIALVGREEVHDHVAVVHYQPAVAGFAFQPAFLFMLCTHVIYDRFCQGVQHAVAGAVADDEVVGEGGNVFQIEQQNVFALFFFQGVDDGAGKFKCVQ